MGGGANLYSIEAISDALIGAGSIAASSQDEQQIIRGYLQPLQNVLQAECVVFYASEASPLTPMQPMKLQNESAAPLEIPQSIKPAMEAFIRNAPHQTITSQDSAFMLGHLRSAGGACASWSSMWSSVPTGDADFGTVGVLDCPLREFGRVEQQVLRTFSLQLSYALKSFATRKQTKQQPAKKSSLREVDRYIESTKLIGNVSRDLINPLTAIMGYIDLLKAESLDDRCKQYIQKLQSQTEKMQDIVMALNSAPHARIRSSEAEPEEAIPSQISLVPALPSAPAPAIKPARSSTGRSRVLIVQKSEAVAEFEKTVLSALNAEVITAASGVEALTLLQSADVHAVILDDELEGEWRGKKLLDWIQENRPDLSKRLLLTVSQRPKDEIKEMIEKLGVAHVTKPLQIMDLFTGMRQMLGFSPEALDKKFLN
ncbi:MAG: multi-sensor hybrid histidine kinase [Candidatus Angelobacter sp.]|jgi:CheY-like chemotaxis protein|nr:multi-sensor hybrid histidine kinase [Candidatus Angelobacter sp.]